MKREYIKPSSKTLPFVSVHHFCAGSGPDNPEDKTTFDVIGEEGGPGGTGSEETGPQSRELWGWGSYE